jgi:hypothetical protein
MCKLLGGGEWGGMRVGEGLFSLPTLPLVSVHSIVARSISKSRSYYTAVYKTEIGVVKLGIRGGGPRETKSSNAQFRVKGTSILCPDKIVTYRQQVNRLKM